MNAITIKNAVFSWQPELDPILNIPTLDIKQGEKIFLEGPSGSGKTTLLNLISGVTTVSSGNVFVMDQDLKSMRASQRDRIRADHIGFIFQTFNLIPYLSIRENIALPCEFSLNRRKNAETNGSLSGEITRLLYHLGLETELESERAVTMLSVGQQQRVAAARSLIGRPDVVVADEPTSSLDTDTRESFIKLLFQECEIAGITLVFVSHDKSLGHLFDRRILLNEINHVNTN